ncbi:MAG: TRAP transporter small permease [Hyphomicrobiales bacterium]|nr:TRAP transporter small permease [Hyphomicrobiales bacterium]
MRTVLAELATWWAIAGGALLLVITVVTSANVGAFVISALGIYVEGISGYEDFVRLVISCAALMFFPYCQLRYGHISVRLFTNGWPAVLTRAIDRLWLALTVCITLFLTYWMFIGLLETHADQTSTSILGWLEWPYYIPGLISLILWSAIAAMQLVEGAAESPHGA